MRMCIACREMKPKKEMTRVVKTPDGEISADLTGKAAGRGAYICNAEGCLRKLNDKKLLHKAFATAPIGLTNQHLVIIVYGVDYQGI